MGKMICLNTSVVSAIFLHAVSNLFLTFLKSGMFVVILEKLLSFKKPQTWQILCLLLEYIQFKSLMFSSYITGTPHVL